MNKEGDTYEAGSYNIAAASLAGYKSQYLYL